MTGNARRYSEKTLVAPHQSDPVVQAVDLAVLVRGTDPVTQTFVARELKVLVPFPGRSRESRPVRPVYDCYYVTSTTYRLVSGDLLHFEWLKTGRNVLADEVRGGFLGEVAEHILRQPHRDIFWHVTTVVGVGRGFAALYSRRRASAPGMSEGRSDHRSLAPRGDPFGVSSEEQGPTTRNV